MEAGKGNPSGGVVMESVERGWETEKERVLWGFLSTN
jgi:hypothetical protein